MKLGGCMNWISDRTWSSFKLVLLVFLFFFGANLQFSQSCVHFTATLQCYLKTKLGTTHTYIVLLWMRLTLFFIESIKPLSYYTFFSEFHSSDFKVRIQTFSQNSEIKVIILTLNSCFRGHIIIICCVKGHPRGHPIFFLLLLHVWRALPLVFATPVCISACFLTMALSPPLILGVGLL